MSFITRIGPKVGRSALFHQSRHQMASTSVASDPVQKLFADKIKEFRTTNKGLDENHKRLLSEEMSRLARVYKVENEAKLAVLDLSFPAEVDVSLRDIDERKEARDMIASGQYQPQAMTAKTPDENLLLSTIPEQVVPEFGMPSYNKPSSKAFLANLGLPKATETGSALPDYEFVGDKMTPKKLEEDLRVSFGENMPTVDDDKSPQRDTVNFPRIHQAEDTPPTRYHIIPETWFQFFYPKTGITGPYIFAGSLTTFLLSKEWLVWEHELLAGLTSTFIYTFVIIKYGPQVGPWLRKETKAQFDAWEEWRAGNVKLMDQIKSHYQNELDKSETIKEIYDIRRQDVEAQLVTEQRERIKSVHDNVKQRLNYLVAKATSERQILHKNMVNWVITNAVQSFGQKQENEVLDSCIVDLKNLARKNANVI